MVQYILIVISAVLVNNFVLTRFLGICPFLGVSKKLSTALGMCGAVIFVMTCASAVTWILQSCVLDPIGIGYMQTIAFILVIASFVQLVDIAMKKFAPKLHGALGIFLPLITTNCAVLGVAVLAVQKDFNLLESAVYAIGNAVGFGLALITFSGIREQLDLLDVPARMKGVPIAFIVAGLMALAFMGFAGIV